MHTLTNLGLLGLLLASPVLASAASPWLPPPGSHALSFAYPHTSAEELFAGEVEAPLPADLDQDNFLFTYEYGVSDHFAVSFATGYARTDFIEDPGLSPEAKLDGLIDPRLSARYRLWDELDDGGATVTLQAAGFIDGGYDTGALNAIGDGANGFEVSGLVGKLWDLGLALSGEIGYRIRDDDVPDDWFATTLTSKLSARITFNHVDAVHGIDIGGPGFTPARFPEVEEDREVLGGGIGYRFSEHLATEVSYGQVLDGRNTAKQEIIGVVVSYSF